MDGYAHKSPFSFSNLRKIVLNLAVRFRENPAIDANYSWLVTSALTLPSWLHQSAWEQLCKLTEVSHCTVIWI